MTSKTKAAPKAAEAAADHAETAAQPDTAQERDPALPPESYQVDMNDSRPLHVIRAEQAEREQG